MACRSLLLIGRRLQAVRARTFSTSSILDSSDTYHHSTVDAILKERIKNGELLPDRAQKRAARRLTRLQEALAGYSNESLLRLQIEKENRKEEKHIQESIENERSINNNKEECEETQPEEESFRMPRGLFLFGEVGTGKSMLMDTFVAQVPLDRKRRVHFHSFMQDVHRRIHALKQDDLRKHGRNFHIDTSKQNNPVVRVARQLSKEVALLCFDEFQVTDVADALILKQLFQVLFESGTVVVATSNRPPSDLYEGGINRSYFMPFVDLIHRQCIVHEMQSNVDYRRKLFSQDLHHGFLVEASAKTCSEAFEKLLNGREQCCVDLSVGFNRTLTVHQADSAGLVCRFDFDQLCNTNLGSSDYRAIAQHFSVVIVEGVPVLTLKEHDQARRFITLVDELYEARCALLCSAVAHPDELFRSYCDKQQHQNDGIETKVGEMFGIDVAQSNGETAGELASVRELSFAFRRASSRLTEMCSRPWWERVLAE